jgi:hypothetical protein
MPAAGAADLGPPGGTFPSVIAMARQFPRTRVGPQLATGVPPAAREASDFRTAYVGVAIGDFNSSPVATFFGEKRLSG